MPSKSTDAAIAVTAPVAAPALNPLHDLQHQMRLVREALTSEKRCVGLFIGAGAPLGIYDAAGAASLKLLPDVAGLTTAITEVLKGEAEFAKQWDQLLAACQTAELPHPNVEHLLTQMRTFCALKGDRTFDGITTAQLRRLDDRICSAIVKILGAGLPGHVTSYHRLAAWISQLQRMHPLQIFTPNYDLLLEEALENFRVPYFDGFIGSREPFFDLASLEQDVLPERWTRLWKLHGSLNWVKKGDGSVSRRSGPGSEAMIYPSHLKYDQSRRMPYLAMLDRLKVFMRESNAVLVCCGYSFADEHLNEVMLDGLRGNRTAQAFALMYRDISGSADVVRLASKQVNLTVIAHDGAVIGARAGRFLEVDRHQSPQGSGYVVTSVPGRPADHPKMEVRCLLGDFHHFAMFLETQFGVRTTHEIA